MKRFYKLLSAGLAATMLFPCFATFPAVSTSAKESAPGAEESRKTPIMGWASWNAYRTDISEESILSQANKLKELGLADLGYVFVNVDDGWQNGRGADGLVNINTERFPSGMKHLADTIHSMGLKAGIYSDAGAHTCGWESDNQVNNYNVGLYGHEDEDLRRYLIEWGYDFIKVDWCGGRRGNMNKQERYTAIGNVIKEIEKETGEDKIYNVCCWSFPGPWVVDVADSWRTGGDIFNNFGAILEQLDNIKSLAQYTGPGHVNDLDMMQVGNALSYEEDKSHFAMWCMMSTPLMLGMDLNSISEETLSIISNAELIALNQDPACIQATVAKNYGNVEAWTKDLGSADSGTKAIALLNRGSSESKVKISFEDLGLEGVTAVRDLWAHTDVSVDGMFEVTIPSHGTVVLKATGTPVASAGDDEQIIKDDGSVVNAEMTVKKKESQMNLTAAGKYDWVHFASATTRMKNGAGEISLGYGGTYLTYGNAAATYSWNNGDNPQKGSSTGGVGVKGAGSYMYITTPCDGNPRTLTVSVGSYSANMKIELIVGGKVIATKNVPGGADRKEDRTVTAVYSSDIPTKAYLRWSVTNSLGNSDSVNVEGVALNIDIQANTIGIPTVVQKRENGKNILDVSLSATAVTEGKIVFLLENEDGSPADIRTVAVETGRKTYHATVSTDHNMKGLLRAFLWDKENVPLTGSTETAVDTAAITEYAIGPVTAKALLEKGAVLLDVRSKTEYDAGHLEGAINLDYGKVALEAEKLLKDKDQTIIVYCSAAKRSTQALTALMKLGYTDVYNLGSMQNFRVEPTLTFAGSTCRVITAGEKVDVSFTASPFDNLSVYLSVGKNSSFKDAIPQDEFKVPDYDGYYLTVKAYLVHEGRCYAETEKQFIYWSEKTVDTFATDITWDKATIGWGTIHKNQSVDGHSITLAGKTFAHGIGTHANSEIEMAIPKGAKKFLAVAGCDLEMKGSETMMFFVYIDGKQVAQSSLIKIGQYYVFDVDIPEGAEKILLYAYEGTYGGNTNDHADWAVAGFMNDVKGE